MRVRALMTFCVSILFMVALNGCGGGGQSGNESQGDESGGKKAEKAGSGKKGRTPPELTNASGTLGRIDTEKGILTLRPEEGDQPMRFRFNPDAAEVTVDGKVAGLGDLAGGQEAEVGYFERESRMVARTVSAKGLEFATARGTLGVVDTERGVLTMRPEGGGEPLRFRFNSKNLEALKVSIGGKEASPEELRGGQKAEVRYSEKNGRKITRAVFVESGE